MLGLLTITFFVARVMPIDPVLAVVGDSASEETYRATYIELGLDRPLAVQYAIFLGDLLVGDLGTSLLTSRPVIEDIGRVFPATLELATAAILVGVLAGVPMGVTAAVHHGRWPDYVIRIVGLFGYSMPIFWVGLMGLFLFYGVLGWVGGPGRLDFHFEGTIRPITGMILVDTLISGNLSAFRNAIAHIILPASVLGYYSVAYISRMTRSLMLDQLGQEYVVTARVKGLSETRVVWRHALANVAVPLVTVISLSYASLLEGSVLTEIIFSWPGLGLYITDALLSADMSAVLGGTIVVGLVFIIINMLSDILYRILDPRIE